jgi:cysteine desulfurase/selenocysteine lyase
LTVRIDWDGIRAQFPALEHWTYLNTATFGQLPRCAVEAVNRHFEHRDELACSDFIDWFTSLDRIRESISKLIHCTADDIAFVPNASSALALWINGTDWKPGDRIVTLAGEFPNNLYSPALLAGRGVEFIQTPWEQFDEAWTPNTRAVLMSTVNYTNGFCPPLEEIGNKLRVRGITFYLDGTQSVGALEFDVRRIQPDLLAVHGYKWLLSPNGAGFLYVRPEVRKSLSPTVIGWRSDRNWREVDELNHGVPAFSDKAEKYEGGMPNFPGVFAMGASVDMMLEIGVANIHARVMDLASQTRQVLEARGGIVAHDTSPILAAKFEGVQTSSLVARLKQRRIEVSARHGNLRVSLHFYNNERDIAVLDRALQEELP